jgi:hypothetical protein
MAFNQEDWCDIIKIVSKARHSASIIVSIIHTSPTKNADVAGNY